jgi:3-hydroxyisobutyrate dehydrogenase-like beta-hydroxyacid dehydrogenase
MLQGKFDFGFAVDWMIKDLQHCLDEAARNGSKLPITADILAFYRELSSDGGGRMDTSSLIERL